MYAEINCISYFDFIFRLTAITLPSPVVLPSHCAMFSYPIDYTTPKLLTRIIAAVRV